MNWQIEMEKRVVEVESIIKNQLPAEEGYIRRIAEAMNYSISTPGKRIRPILMLETYRLFGGQGKVIEPFLAAIEMIHTYSLVHDDLPAMDNDDYRRGRKTTHVVYGEGMAILAGDGLLNLAFETAVKAFSCEPGDFSPAKALEILASKSGIYGMIGGQTVDIETEGMTAEEVTKERLLFIHEKKTAALIEASMMIGAVLAKVDEQQLNTIEQIARNIGVAFQIQDDILDVTGDQEVLGKPVGSDEKNDKVTYVTLKGLEEARKMVEMLSGEAIRLLDVFPNDPEWLRQTILYLITREK